MWLDQSQRYSVHFQLLTLAFYFLQLFLQVILYIFRELERSFYLRTVWLVFSQLVIEMFSKHTLFSTVLLWGEIYLLWIVFEAIKMSYFVFFCLSLGVGGWCAILIQIKWSLFHMFCLKACNFTTVDGGNEVWWRKRGRKLHLLFPACPGEFESEQANRFYTRHLPWH